MALSQSDRTLSTVLSTIAPWLMAYAQKLSPRRRDWDDLFQSGLIRVAESLVEYRANPKFTLEAFLFYRAKGAMLHYRRDFLTLNSQEICSGKTLLPTCPWAEISLEGFVDWDFLSHTETPQVLDRIEINDLLTRLRAPYRQILVLHYMEEYTLPEIARLLEIHPKTATNRHRAAILAARRILNDLRKPEPDAARTTHSGATSPRRG